ncbi:MAG: hypothetical protein AAF253_02650 [Pseudomonadota bacterium]
MVALWMHECQRDGVPIGELWVDESGMIYRVPPARFGLVRSVAPIALAPISTDTALGLSAGQGGFALADDGWLAPASEHFSSPSAHAANRHHARKGEADIQSRPATPGSLGALAPTHRPSTHHPPPG